MRSPNELAKPCFKGLLIGQQGWPQSQLDRDDVLQSGDYGRKGILPRALPDDTPCPMEPTTCSLARGNVDTIGKS